MTLHSTIREGSLFKSAAGGVTPEEDDVDDGEFRKTVEFEKTDDEEQIAYGAVLVPDRVDHHGEFFRPDTIADLAENFEERVEERDAVPGVMHAVFPDHIDLVKNQILDEPTTLGEKELPAGSWIQGWQYQDDKLWELVKDLVLTGNSIGGTVEARITYEGGAHPDDVEFPDPVKEEIEEAGLDPEEVRISEVAEARVLEVSTVDMPAVPDSTHEEYKSLAKAVEKEAPALTSSVVDARLYLERRGHSEEDAKRLAEYLNDEKAREATGWIERAKRFFTGDGEGVQRQRQWDTQASETSDEDPRGERSEKDGRTLSAENRANVMAAHDAALTMLEGADVDTGVRSRFTDDPSSDFNIEDYGSSESAQASTSDERAESRTGQATDDDVLENMNADDLEERFDSFDSRIESMEDTIQDALGDAGDGGGDGEGGQEKNTEGDGGGDDADVDVEALQETVEQLADNQQQIANAQEQTMDTLERMAEAQGVSQQADTGEGVSETDETWGKTSPFAPGSGGEA